MDEKTYSIIKGSKIHSISIDELKNEISQILQIDNLNILIGAGCSSWRDKENNEKAIPIMSNLSKRFFDENPNFKINGIDMSLHFNTNLEAMMDYILAVKSANSIKTNPRSIDSKIKIIYQFIYNQILSGMNCSEVFELYRNFYLRLITNSRKTPINIYTTNYDLYTEEALDSLGFFYNNGFVGTTKRVFNPNQYNYVMVENMNVKNDSWKRVSNFFNLYKIHGSINWVKENNEIVGNNIVEKPIEVLQQNKKYDSLMIYPTPQKDRTTLMTPYSDMFRLMQNNLYKHSATLITMGYSFSDEHINRIIFNALSVQNFKLIIFGKSIFIDKIQAIDDKRIWIINSDDNIHYFNNIVNQLLPNKDDNTNELQVIKDTFRKLNTLIEDGEKNG